MPRPKKTGLDYYYKGVDEFEDYRIESLVEEYGAMGYMVFDIITSRVYKNGYYLDIPLEHLASKIFRLVTSKWMRDKTEIIKIINYCVEIGLFDKELFAQGIITSKEIQEHYSCVSARRKTDKTKYWLLPSDEEEINVTQAGVIAAETRINTTETGINATISTQRKEKKIKENEIKSSNQIKSNICDAESQNDSNDEVADQKVEMAYYLATGNNLTDKDKNEIYRLKSDGCSDEIIVEAIRDASSRAPTQIHSFAYFTHEIRNRMKSHNYFCEPTSNTAEIESILDAEYFASCANISSEPYVYDD